MCGQLLCGNLIPASIYLAERRGSRQKRGQIEPRPCSWSLGEMVKLSEPPLYYVYNGTTVLVAS